MKKSNAVPATHKVTPPVARPYDAAVVDAAAALVAAFQPQNDHVLTCICSHFDWLRKYAHPSVVDATCARALLGHAIRDAKMLVHDWTAEEFYELERWIDYLPDAYDAAVQWGDRPRRGRPQKGLTDGEIYARYWFRDHPSEMPDVLPDWSMVPCAVSEDAE